MFRLHGFNVRLFCGPASLDSHDSSIGFRVSCPPRPEGPAICHVRRFGRTLKIPDDEALRGRTDVKMRLAG